ncbi:MAG TPA: trypsin-like peptidase domain-containing protein, partial [Telmatospirillum sp.]|nr:trypsin-like peptidase domain-containing protein [Telmatospirillum sp.]
TPIPIPAGTASRSILFKTLASRIENGTVIGATELGASCVPNGVININHGAPGRPAPLWARPFYKELKAANYNVLSDPDNLFEDKTTWRPDLLVGATVQGDKENRCFPDGTVNALAAVRAEISLDIEWQIFDTSTNSVALTIATHGYAVSTTAVPNGRQHVFETAIGNNVKALLADPAFNALVVSPAKAAAGTGPLRFKGRSPFGGAIVGHMQDVQNGVVTVLHGAEHGSGFVVNRDGYVITDSHVVGDAHEVRLRQANGHEMIGDVLSVERRHDVALIKAREAMPDALPVSITPVAVGSEVYAVGAPLSTSLSGSVTKGIVSGYRNINGIPQIQSDVSIQPGNSGGPLLDAEGNVVGMARAMLLRGTSSTGVNLFTPIDQALQAAGIELQE